MRAIKCEMCGSQDLIKSDGLYVCQSCGTKYSPEAATKLFAEISGPITLDRTAELHNFIILARRAVVGKEYVKAKNYYDKALLINANCWEAELFSLIFSSINTGEPLAKSSLVLEMVATVLKDTKQNIESDEQKKVLDAVFEELNYYSSHINKCAYFICYEIEENNKKSKKTPEIEQFINKLTTSMYFSTNKLNSAEYYKVVASLIEYVVDFFEVYGQQVAKLFGAEYKNYVVSAYKICFEFYNRYYESVEELNNERRQRIISYLCDNDPSFMQKFLRDENLKELDKLIEYFEKKQQLYDDIENAKITISDTEGVSLQELPTTNGLIIRIIVVGWILFGIGAIFGFAFFLVGLIDIFEGSVGSGFLLVLASVGSIAPGLLIALFGIKQRQKFYDEYNRVKENNDLARKRTNAKGKLTTITAELTAYHKKYKDCEVRLADSNPKVLKELRNIIRSGNADTIKEAVSYFHSNQ